MIESAVTARGQTTLPKRVRKSLGLESGDRIRYLRRGPAVESGVSDGVGGYPQTARTKNSQLGGDGTDA